MFSSIIRSTKPNRTYIYTIKDELAKSRTTTTTTSSRELSDDANNRSSTKYDGQNSDSKAVAEVNINEVLEREFPSYYSEGKFVSRIAYVDFIDQALEKLVELGLEKNLNAYKELLKIFPPGRYHPNSVWDLGLHHAPQQLSAIRLLTQMEKNMVRPDKEVEVLAIRAFSKSSAVWQKAARLNYWSMKARYMDPQPIPEKVPEKPHELAKVAICRMLEDQRSVVTVTNTSSLPDVVDKTWVVYSQSSTQQAILDRLDEKKILYIEESGLTYVGSKYLSYFILKVYDDEETIKERSVVREKDFNYNTVKVKFFGKPLKEKLAEMEQVHHVEDGYVLAIGMTGTSSHDSVLSWLKILQKRNPKLNKLSVVFRLKRPTGDIMDPNAEKRPSEQ